jgi:hypothetical protein
MQPLVVLYRNHVPIAHALSGRRRLAGSSPCSRERKSGIPGSEGGFRLRTRAGPRLPTPDDPIACDSTLLDLKGIAAWTRYDKSQLTRLINKSNLPFMTFDGKKWFLLHDVQHWFTKQVAERKVRGAQRGRIKFNQYCGNAGPLIWFNPPDAL